MIDVARNIALSIAEARHKDRLRFIDEASRLKAIKAKERDKLTELSHKRRSKDFSRIMSIKIGEYDS